MKLETILVAVDFSDESEIAVTQAVGLARHHEAKLISLHVGSVPDQPIGALSSMQAPMAEYLRLVEDDLARDRKRLADLCERISGQGVEVSDMFLDGDPQKGICAAADHAGADLVVLGTHGRTGLKRFFLGSIAEKVVRSSTRPILVARQQTGGEPGLYRRILVTTDFSPAADLALEMAVDIAAPGAHIDLLHCWHFPPMTYPYYAPTKSAQDTVAWLRESITEGTKERGDEFIQRHGRAGMEMDFHQLEQAPAHGIQWWLEEHDCDLVVTGSHGRHMPARLLLGSVAESCVRHSPCSVLVVHPSTDPAKSS